MWSVSAAVPTATAGDPATPPAESTPSTSLSRIAAEGVSAGEGGLRHNTVCLAVAQAKQHQYSHDRNPGGRMTSPSSQPLLRDVIDIPERTSDSDFVLKLTEGVADAAG